jgi:hypothetical protein
MAKNFSVTTASRRARGGTRRGGLTAVRALRGTPPAHKPHRMDPDSRHICHEDFTILTIIGRRLAGIARPSRVSPGGRAAAFDGSFQVAPMV